MNQDYESGRELARKMDELMRRPAEAGAETLVDEAIQDAETAE